MKHSTIEDLVKNGIKLSEVMVPYIDNTRSFHSPVFASSLETFEYLELLAIKNKWNLIYKPHPIMNYLGHIADSDRLYADIVLEVDIHSVIDASDLVVTILFQRAYVGLIRKKPVVMLGYMQLRGKRCTYEAFSKSDIECQITQALHKGYTIFKKQLQEAKLWDKYRVQYNTWKETYGRLYAGKFKRDGRIQNVIEDTLLSYSQDKRSVLRLL